MTKTDQGLGPLQQEVLDFVWDNPGCTVRHCLDSLISAGRDYAYTTIQTVFDVLHRKGMVSRRRRKNAYLYTAKKTKAIFLTEKLTDLLKRFGSRPEPVASSLVDALEGADTGEIESLVAELKSRGHIK